jgi:peptidoglycan/LPS O-acetylase OafA/YrhL
MGLLRVFLALSVVVCHANAPFAQYLIWADVAVKLFFIISGFYMSLILSGKYRKDRYWFFYSNRMLRLYPSYLIAFLLTLGVAFAAEALPNAPERSALVAELLHRFTGGPTQLSAAELAAVLVPNLFLFGSDIIFLFYHSVMYGWEFTFGLSGTHAGAVRTGVYLVVSPAWSIGVELWFYLIAPVLVRFKTVFVVMLAAASLALRLWMDWRHPWSTYFFFPAALCFFLFGVLAHRFWASSTFKRIAMPSLTWKITIAGLILLILRYAFPGYRNYPELIYAVLICAMPFIFEAFKNIPWDRWIGNLSYPIYLLHTAVIAAFHNYLGSLNVIAVGAVGTVTILLAVLVNVSVDEPLERYRQRRVARRHRGPDARNPSPSQLTRTANPNELE